MSTAPKAAAFAVLLRIFYGAYPSIQQHWWGLFWILAAVSMTLGNLAALRQQSVKRMLAYSSIAHAGICWSPSPRSRLPASRRPLSMRSAMPR